LWDEIRSDISIAFCDRSSVRGSDRDDTNFIECIKWLSRIIVAVGAGEDAAITFSIIDGEFIVRKVYEDTSFIFEASVGLNKVICGNISAFKDHLPSDFGVGSSGELIGSFLNLNLECNSDVSCSNIGD